MVRKQVTRVTAVVVGFALVIASSQNPGVAQAADAGTPTQTAAMSQNELQALVAPIALYPDNLVAEVLAASTFPDQVAIANYWLQQNTTLTGNALVQAVDKQSWDASVKGLTAFPKVLGNMAKSLSWTSQLGEAYHNQKAEVMTAVQTLRSQAKAAGNLKSTPQITVVQQTPQTIVIQPANPQVVYVPQYNPAAIYGYPYVTPGYTAGDLALASGLSFGAGVAMGAFMGGGWGWNAWGCDWHGGAVLYNHGAFYGNTAWHGGYAGGYHPYGYDGGYHPYGNYNRNQFNRNVSGNQFNRTVNNVNVNRSSAFSNNHFGDTNSWAQHNNFAGRSNAFSGLGSHGGDFSGLGGGGWGARADSARGWGSMRASGAGGFHSFGGFGGGGGFHGGGGRR